MTKALLASALALVLCLLAACLPGRTQKKPLAVVAHVDLPRYLGRWYEIARYPHWFEEGCTKVTAEYAKNVDGSLAVLNQCLKKGEWSRAKGRAKVVDTTSNAKLKVSFFWPFYGDYWILKIDPDYRYAVVGAPSRKYLWILSRTPTLPAELLQEAWQEIAALDFDPDKLILTEQ